MPGVADPDPALPDVPAAIAGTLRDVLQEAADLGFLGPGPIEPHVVHARGFVPRLRSTDRVLDLGTGGGVPGLIIAALLPAVAVVLLDARTNRTDFLSRAVGRLGWADRVTVVAARAEELGRDDRWRAQVPAVVARSFGSPSATAECAAPLLSVGGQLLVSEPPEARPGRWPAEGLALVGLRGDGPSGTPVASFTQVEVCPARFPRRRLRPELFDLVGST